jgi:hypothetical protein
MFDSVHLSFILVPCTASVSMVIMESLTLVAFEGVWTNYLLQKCKFYAKQISPHCYTVKLGSTGAMQATRANLSNHYLP